MRILHVVGAMNVGGTETWLLQLLRHFHRQKYQIDILVHTTKPGDYDKEVKDLCVRIIPCLKPSNPLTYAYNFRRIILAYGPYDCVHCHMHQFTGYVLFLAALMGIPMRLAHSHTDTRKLDRNAFFVRKAYMYGILSAALRNPRRRHYCKRRGLSVFRVLEGRSEMEYLSHRYRLRPIRRRCKSVRGTCRAGHNAG